MEVEERFGLKKRHTYDEIVQWLNSDPKGVAYPSRVAYNTYNSHVYGQLKDSLRAIRQRPSTSNWIKRRSRRAVETLLM